MERRAVKDFGSLPITENSMAMPETSARTRIQEKNISTILDAALEVFSGAGFRGATLDQIARAASLSKPNLLYYFKSKEAIHRALLSELLETWLAPLRTLDSGGEPVDEIVRYVMRKLDMARELPRESRLFANEIVQGAPHILDIIEGPLKDAGRRKGVADPQMGGRGPNCRGGPLSPDLLDLGHHAALRGL